MKCIVLVVGFVLNGPELFSVKVDLRLIEIKIGNIPHLMIDIMHLCEI
jgi:hypothetical protein